MKSRTVWGVIISLTIVMIIFLILITRLIIPDHDITQLTLSFKPFIGFDDTDRNLVLYKPSTIRCDLHDNIYLLDQGNARIMVYDSSGTWMNQIGKKGRGPGEFLDPTDFYIDKFNNIYVVDVGNRKVAMFDSAQNYQNEFRIEATYLAPLNRIAVSFKGEIYLHLPEHGYLFSVYSKNGLLIKRFGDLREYNYIHKNIFARMLFNQIAFDFDDEGYLNVLFLSMPVFRRYDPDLKLIFEKEIQTKEMKCITQDYKKQLKRNPPKDPTTISFPLYFCDLLVKRNGESLVALGRGRGFYYISKSGEAIFYYKPQPYKQSPDIHRLCETKKGDLIGVDRFDYIAYLYQFESSY